MKFEPWRLRRRGKGFYWRATQLDLCSRQGFSAAKLTGGANTTCAGLQTSFSITCALQLQSSPVKSSPYSLHVLGLCLSLKLDMAKFTVSVTAHGPSFSVYLHTQTSTFCPAAPLHLRPLCMQFRWASDNSLPLCFDCLLVKTQQHALSLK